MIDSEHSDPTTYFSNMGQYAASLKEKTKGVVFLADTFIFALLGSKDMIDQKVLEEKLKELGNEKPVIKKMEKISFKIKGQKKPTQTKDVVQLAITGVKFDKESMQKFLSEQGFDIDQ